MVRIVRMSLLSLVVAIAAVPPVAGDDDAPLRLRATRDVRALERVGDSLWIGTTGGLFIYDLGNDVFSDPASIEAQLPPGAVRVIRAKGDSVLIGTDGGLGIFSGGTMSVLSPQRNRRYRGIPLQQIRAIDIGLGGEIFLGTYGLGLAVIGPEGAYAITREDSLLDNKVYGTVQQDDTTYYYATSMGLCAWRDSLWVNFQAGAGIPRGEIRQIVPIKDGVYYLLVARRGIYRFNGARARRVSSGDLFPEDDVAAITVDTRGNLWAAGRFGGIASYRGGRWRPVAKSDPKIWQQPWRCAASDGEGGVFFGAASGLVVGVKENHVAVARQLPVLKSVIQHANRCAKVLDCFLACCSALASNNYRHTRTITRQNQRLVACC